MREADPGDLDVRRVRRLLLRIVYRSVYDWMLYRQSKSPPRRRLAAAGFRWLFINWSDDGFCSFRSICAIFDKKPQEVRNWVLTLDLRTVSALYRGKPTTFWSEHP